MKLENINILYKNKNKRITQMDAICSKFKKVTNDE